MTVVCIALGGAASADAQTVKNEGVAAPALSTQAENNADEPPAANQSNVSHIGNVIPEPPESARQGPLASLGQKLNDWGFTPSLNLTQMYLGNPSAGQQTGNHEILTFVAVGGDFDLQKIAGFPGATIHFQQVFAPFTTNVTWGNQVGDTLGGKPGPFVPQKAHLAVFTWEQKAFGDRLDFEVGKSSPDNYFALPVCNQGFGCTSALLYDSAGMNPPIYPNWSARVRYSLTPAWSFQVGVWRSNAQYPWTNGWEWTDKTPDSNAWLANVVYHTTYQTDPYPKSYELMFYYNTGKQTDPYTLGTHKGTSGIYFGGRQVIYRPDGGKSTIDDPTAVALFATATGSFDSHNSDGLSMTGTAGVTLEAPLRSRPHDSVSLSVNWATVTPHDHAYLEQANLAAGGSGYAVGRTEYGLRLDANVELTRSIVLSPYVMRTWKMNTWLNPAYAGTPRNGVVFGVLATVFIDKMLGLTDH
ncbi:carbohydrate porin [Paraburkholderia sp. Ac-20347]|uniref:carbohydrate porin n=1 Tax=Paraburkholderia sp. Ac-20347 TaxID=2703892 RepID=UPI00197F2E98|nr:carbohydrate porin [Paraburkholderia sp. Ac-20347]MBN3814948.1 porin [Paraburkholderia sp. Ac-20347]